MSKETLRIKKGGKLVETKWVYDHAKQEGEYQDFDRTSTAVRHMFEQCELEEGVTLKDIFLLLNSELEVFDAVIGNWCQEIVTEGLTQPAKPYDLTDEEAVEFLDLRWDWYYDDASQYGPSFYGHGRPNLGGTGIARTKVKYFDWNDKNGNPEVEYNIGDRTPWAISFTPANELINVPVRLMNEAVVYDDNTDKGFDVQNKTGYGFPIATYKNPTFTLGNILYGIIWELSFFGGPDKRQEKKDELFKIVDDIKNE